MFTLIPPYKIASERNKVFVEKYRRRTDQSPPLASFSAYNGVAILAQLAKQVGAYRTKSSIDVLKKGTFETLMGKVRFRQDDHTLVGEMVVSEVSSAPLYPFMKHAVSTPIPIKYLAEAPEASIIKYGKVTFQ